MGKDHRTKPRKPKIGIALGGGGARGLAHIVVLEVLDELNVRPDIISGTSIGAIMGAAYASGLSAADIRNYARDRLSRRRALFRELITKRGAPLTKMLGALQLRSALLKADKLLDIVMPPDMSGQFEDLAIPLRIVATEFYQQREVVFSSGPLRPAVAASMAVPVIMSAVEFNGATYYDGGLVNPLPYDVIADDVDIVIAVNVLGGPDNGGDEFVDVLEPKKDRPSAMKALVRSSQILQRTIVREKLKTAQPDILLDIDTGKYNAADFMKLDKILDAAAPAKDEFKRKLTRVLNAQTLHDVAEDINGNGAADVSSAHTSDHASSGQRLSERLMQG